MVRAAVLLALLLAAPAAARPPAPGAPGAKAKWAAPDKHALGTAAARKSRVWFTLRSASLSEVFYPDVEHPSARGVDFWIDGKREAGTSAVALTDPASLTYRQTVTAKRWRLTKTYVTDPARAVLLVQVRLDALDGRDHTLVIRYDPSLYGDGDDDVGWTRGHALLAHDTHVAGALAAKPALGRTSSGYAGRSAGDLVHQYDALTRGNVVQTAATSLTGRGGHRDLTLALGFGLRATPALTAARASLHSGFTQVSAAYAAGWKAWRAKLAPIPAAAVPYAQTYETSLLLLRAAEDKATPGLFAAAPAAGHTGGAVDIYQAATALLIAGAVEDADAAVDVLLARFPHSPYGPLLAWELARTDGDTWGRVKPVADYLTAHAANAAAIAALVCSADLARRNGAAAKRYEKAADAAQRAVKPAGQEALELVRLGDKPAADPAVVAAVQALKPDTAWWQTGLRGEYELLAGRPATAQLAALAGAAGDGGALPEQVKAATPVSPFTWSHAQFVRLAWDMEAGRALEQPSVVAARYAPAAP